MSRPARDGRGLESITEAAAALAQARTSLDDAVRRAHSEGWSWADIGQVLGISRQAAFKKFGQPRDPRTGETMRRRTVRSALELTERVFGLIDQGDYPGLRRLMTEATAAVLTEQVVLDTWASAVADVGNLRRCSGTTIEQPDGSTLDPDDQVLGTVIGDTTVECEAGELRGRVAMDGNGKVVGLLVVPPGSTDLPF